MFTLRTITKALIVLSTLVASANVAQAQDEPLAKNSLIVEEVTPLSNAGFEGNLKDWGGNAKDEFQTAGALRSETTAFAGAKSAAMSANGYRPRYFQLPTGQKFYVTAQIKTVGDARGSIRVVYGASGEPSSASVPPNSDWTRVGVTFTTNDKGRPKDWEPTISRLEIRLQADIAEKAEGAPTVYFDDIRVYRLREYAPHFRVRVLEGMESPWRMKVYAKVGSPNWFWGRNYFWKEGVKVGEWSPWNSLEDGLGGRGEASAGFQFEDLKGQRPANITLEVAFAYAPEDAATIKTEKIQLRGGVAGFLLPKNENAPESFLAGFRTLASEIEERNARTKALFDKPAPLSKFYFEAHLKGFGQFFSDPALAEKEVDTIRSIGFNALDTQYSGLAGDYRIAAEKHGIFQTHHTIRGFDLPMNDQKQAILDWPRIEANINAAVQKWHENLVKQDEKQIPLIKLIDIGDEIGGFVFSGPEYEAGYRQYLKEQHVPHAPLGFASAEAVKPYGIWSWRDARKNKPDVGNIEACRSYYWTLRFWNYCNARTYALMTRALEKQFPGVKTRINFGPPWSYEYGSYLRGAEMWEFARQRGVTSFWNEDWLNTKGWRNSGIQMMAYETDLNRSLAQLQEKLWKNPADWNMMVMPEDETNIQLKLASTVGKGTKMMDLYRYGPAYASPDTWSHNYSMAKGIGNFIRDIHGAEDVLHPARPRPTRTAILWSASNDIWRDSEAMGHDREMIYLALLHRQIPVDFVDEFEVAAGALKNYDVLYLPAQYVRRDALRAISQWVQAGGKLWADGVAGTGDEYGQPSDILLPALGIANAKIIQHEKANYNPQRLNAQKPHGTIKFADNGEEISAVGWRIDFTPRNATSRVLAAYEDGKPAVIETTFGKGRVQYVGTLAGLTYNYPVERIPGRIETGYREQERRLITDFALGAGVSRPVAASVAGVQADLLEGPQGTGVVLANYTGELQERVLLTIKMPKRVASVQSVKTGKVPFTYDEKAGEVKLTVPLELIDFITLQ